MQRIYAFFGKSVARYWPEAILLLSVVCTAAGVYLDFRDLKTDPSVVPAWLGRFASVVVAFGVIRAVLLVRERLDWVANSVNKPTIDVIADALQKTIDSELAKKKGAPLKPHEIDALQSTVFQIAKDLIAKMSHAIIFKKDLDAADHRAKSAYEPYLIIGGTLIWGWGDWLVTKL